MFCTRLFADLTSSNVLSLDKKNKIFIFILFCTRLFVHLHIESKATIMICPECKSNVNDELKYCPECGAPLPKKKKQAADNGEPKLRRPMIIFIIVGTALLILLSILSYTNFSGQSGKAIAFDPDTTLLGKEKPAYEEMPSDTAKADSIDKAEKEEAKKVYNSIRKEEAKEEASDGSTTEGESTSSGNTGEGSSEQKTVEPISVAPANKPKVESIEN